MPYSTLITATTLRDKLAAPDWLIIDVRHELSAPAAGREGWRAGHIPGAFFLHMDDDLSAPKTGHNGRHPLPDREVFTARLRQLGANPDTQIIVYDAQAGMMAARLWWMLRWIGHEAVAVLDGGLTAWQTIGGALEAVEPTARPAGELREQDSLAPSVDAATVLTNIATKARLVIDARGPDRFRGENETIDPVGGHIPGARNRFFRDNLTEDGCFKAPAQLKTEFAAILNGRPATEIVAQCGSGVTACHNLLALEVAGLPGAALYPGSWSEWCSDPARPVATGDEPTES